MTAEEALAKIDVRAAVEAAIAREWWLLRGPDGCAHINDRQHAHFLGIGEAPITLPRAVLAARLEALVRAAPERWLPPTCASPLDYTGADADSLTREIALLLDWAA